MSHDKWHTDGRRHAGDTFAPDSDQCLPVQFSTYMRTDNPLDTQLICAQYNRPSTQTC